MEINYIKEGSFDLDAMVSYWKNNSEISLNNTKEYLACSCLTDFQCITHCGMLTPQPCTCVVLGRCTCHDRCFCPGGQ